MARLKKGIFNGFYGVIGGVEGYELNGQYILRSRRRKSTRPPTEKQLACRLKMKLVNDMLKCFPDFVKLGFAIAAQNQTFTAYNAAVAYQLTHAITGSYPAYEINYSQVLVAQSSAPAIQVTASVSVIARSLQFTWPPHLTYPHSTDHAMLLAYSPYYRQAVVNLCGAKRKQGTETLPIPESWNLQHPIQTYLAFRSEQTGACTNSIYLGSIEQ
ncbi:DUF6266 family protein [Chitinophaga pinensis]|uniref:Uncharacterized protein n=1 Tax=Chitinophaga pinensis (strain ATCC 43595 / DSM 2588 / LMG 13176 / NBRC 15968 / NCIMB 11800 / UQM 2034) TaxID=485918 RepID=A0A979G4Q2_CHIPD|nr:DUF6266 family protein [Chitinophaga pinensis]ACU60676.1 hypothetical protein Cpin_3209 [Chitinophaga pinensis DSM 2588]